MENVDYTEGIDLYVCPDCKREYEDFDEMMNCYKDHHDDRYMISDEEEL